MALSARQRSGASSSASGAQRHAIGARALGRAVVRPGLASFFSLSSPSPLRRRESHCERKS